MTKQEFIEKWNVAYENEEQRHEFAIAMMQEINDIIINVLQDEIEAAKQPFIRAKALRKRGTGEYYRWSVGDNCYFESRTHNTYPSFVTIQNGNFIDLPSDAELVDIEILINEP